MKKFLKQTLSIALSSILLISGCGKGSTTPNIVTISLLNSKPEIIEQTRVFLDDFMRDNPTINIKFMQCKPSITAKEKLLSLLHFDNPPTLALVDSAHLGDVKDEAVDLSDQPWINDISGGVTPIMQNSEGQTIAFPFATEGIGFIYNKDILDQAGVDVSTLNTISGMEAAFEKVEAIGKKALVITNDDWSLADHFLGAMYDVAANEAGLDSAAFIEKLPTHPELLTESKAANGLMDMFDVMMKHNIYAENPLDYSNDKSTEIMGQGEVAFWYMGNWASEGILSQNAGVSNIAFTPVPLSNNPSDYGNNEIAVGTTKYIIITKDSSPDQQAAAKEFLNYIVYNERGNTYLTNDCIIIPGFSNIPTEFTDPLANSLLEFRDNDQVIEPMNSYFPSDNSKYVGAAFREYLGGNIDRQTFLQELNDYWTSKA